MSNLYWGAELTVYARLNECSVVAVLASLLLSFEHQTGVAPSIVLMQRSLKGAIIREIAQRFGTDPTKIVSEPIYFGRIPMVFSLRANQDEWMIAKNNSIGFELSL